jgi:gas vesicle protein
MPNELISSVADIVRVVIGAVIGGVVTAASALPYFNNKITKLNEKVENMKSHCASCQASTGEAIKELVTTVQDHHQDDGKHNNSASHTLLLDILNRVTRIESNLINNRIAAELADHSKR